MNEKESLPPFRAEMLSWIESIAQASDLSIPSNKKVFTECEYILISFFDKLKERDIKLINLTSLCELLYIWLTLVIDKHNGEFKKANEDSYALEKLQNEESSENLYNFM